jgi:hypothetical protein
MNRCLLVLYSIVFTLFSYGCECVNTEEDTSYENGQLKTVITRNCKNEILNYKHFSINGTLVFELDYNNLSSQESIQGAPWIHLVWNKEQYVKGDEILLSVDLAVPPNFEVILTINGIELTQRNIIAQGLSVFEFNHTMSNEIEYINLKALFKLKGEKWTTFKKTITLETE